MRFRAKEIVDYLTNIEDKPYNISIRLFNQPGEFKLPLVAIDGPKTEDFVMYSGITKLKKVTFTFEIYGKALSNNGEIVLYQDVIEDIREWLDEALKVKYGFKGRSGSPYLPYGDAKDCYRQVITYTGILSNDGYIYQ